MPQLSATTRPRTVRRGTILVLSTMVCNGFVLISLANAWDNGTLDWGTALLLLPLAICGRALFGRTLNFFTAQRTRPPAVAAMRVAQTTLPAGSPLTFTYQQRFRRRVDSEGITIRLIQQEITYFSDGAGWAALKREQVVQSISHPGDYYGPGDVFADTRTWQVPPTAPPTSRYTATEIHWFLEVQMLLASAGDTVQRYELNVVPAGQVVAVPARRAEVEARPTVS
jgi:hypothetical protein